MSRGKKRKFLRFCGAICSHALHISRSLLDVKWRKFGLGSKSSRAREPGDTDLRGGRNKNDKRENVATLDPTWSATQRPITGLGRAREHPFDSLSLQRPFPAGTFHSSSLFYPTQISNYISTKLSSNDDDSLASTLTTDLTLKKKKK